jgi:hypothetical protein
MDIRWLGCAPRNFRAGRANHRVEAVVIHLIDGSQEGCDATFLDNTLATPVSAHYSISRTAVIHQYVQEEDTAFHAGKLVRPTWPGLKVGAGGAYVNPNLYAIGIEHEGRPNDDWTDAMYAASSALLRDIASRHPGIGALTEQTVAMHRQIRADKTCPGFRFELQRLLAEANRPAPAPVGTPRAVMILKDVNVREGRPSTGAPIVQVIARDDQRPINVAGYAIGEEIDGNAKWYRTVDDNYFWAGATDAPDPE